MRLVVFLEKLANLVEAGVWIHPFLCTREAWTKGYKIGYGDRVFRLLKALNKAKSLTLYPGKKQVRLVLSHFLMFSLFLIDEYCYDYMPQFHDLLN